MVRDFGNIKMNMEGLNRFFQDNGVKISGEDSAKINSIFKECDTENTKGEQKADGELNGQERMNFLNKIKSACPNLYQKVVDFYTAVDVKEDFEQIRQETIDSVKEENKKEQVKGNDADFMS